MTFIPYKHSFKRQPKSGFTLVEVMIVLAIIALILLIVFYVVPSTQRSARNHDRRESAASVAAELENATNNNELSLPGTNTDTTIQAQEQCRFIMDNVTTIGGPATSPVNCASPPIDSSKNCVFISLQRFDVCFHYWPTSAHGYIGSDKEISIQLGHYCGTPGSADYPITTGGGNHETERYVVWIRLESAPVYCIDNYQN